MSPVVCDPAKKRNHRSIVLAELREMQELALNTAKHPECPPQAIAQLMRAYDIMEERKRIIRMKPAPKPLDTTKMRKRYSGTSKALDEPDVSPAPAPTIAN